MAAAPAGPGEIAASLWRNRALIALLAKRDALVQARGGGLPAGRLQPQGEVIWLVDAAAAGV